MPFTKRSILLANLGLDVSVPAEYIDDRATPKGQNMYVNRNAMHKRFGTTAVGGSLGEEAMLAKELLVDETRYVVRAGLSKVQLLNTATGVWIDIGPSANSFTVNATNNKLNFNIGAGELTATIASATYLMGTNQTTAGSLCKAIYDAIHAAEAAGTYTVTFNGSNVVIARSAGTFQMLWKTGTNGADGTDTHIGSLIGFSDAADDTGALSYTADTIVYHPFTGTSADVFSAATPTLNGSRVLCMSNFIDPIRIYTGTGNTSDLSGTPPKAKYIQEYGPYLVLAHVDDGIAKRRMRVQWCDTDDIENWTIGSGSNAGIADLLEDGNDITGSSIFGNYLAVHKESAIYLGYLVPTDAIFQFDRKNTGVGTVCNNTIQNIGENAQIFLARDGIRIFNGISAPLINAPISDELRESMNSSYLHKCWSVVVSELNEYWVGVPIGSRTNPDTVYKYNYVTGQCYKDFVEDVTICGKYQQTTQTTWDNITTTWDASTIRWDDIYLSGLFPALLFGTSSGTTVKRDGSVNNDNGAAVDAYRETKDFESSEKGRLVRWLEMQFWAQGNGVTIDYSVDSGSTWANVGTFALNSDYPSDDAPQYAYFDVISSKIRFRFENNTLNETFSLKDFVIGYSEREVRR